MKQLPVIIIGAGGHCSVIVDLLKLLNVEIIGAVDKDVSIHHQSKWDVPIIGDDSKVNNYHVNEVRLVMGIASSIKTNIRERIFNQFKEEGYTFSTIIHPSAIISKDVVIEEGVQIMAGSIINTASKISSNTLINTRVVIEHETMIENHVHIASGAILCGNVKVRSNVHFGAGATAIEGICIGKSAIIAAGAVVVDDVKDGQTVCGIPAKAK